jgi:hypothetical protein
MQGLGVSACFLLECCYLITPHWKYTKAHCLISGMARTSHGKPMCWLGLGAIASLFAFAELHDRQHIMFKCLGRAALDVLLSSAANSTVHGCMSPAGQLSCRLGSFGSTLPLFAMGALMVLSLQNTRALYVVAYGVPS